MRTGVTRGGTREGREKIVMLSPSAVLRINSAKHLIAREDGAFTRGIRFLAALGMTEDIKQWDRL
jgi:hypothetical protein